MRMKVETRKQKKTISIVKLRTKCRHQINSIRSPVHKIQTISYKNLINLLHNSRKYSLLVTIFL